jgi:hypothetical protein
MGQHRNGSPRHLRKTPLHAATRGGMPKSLRVNGAPPVLAENALNRRMCKPLIGAGKFKESLRDLSGSNSLGMLTKVEQDCVVQMIGQP